MARPVRRQRARRSSAAARSGSPPTTRTAASGTLYELNPATGKVEHQISISEGMPHFSSLSLSGGTAYVSTLTGVTAINGA